ncbi:MAG TPA: hypothetical protein VFP10_03350, partial [Candidatus Eisenbacteria bacterium]|nr:hypothetical protein [Candidatus Eisenbacteria bacterium]
MKPGLHTLRLAIPILVIVAAALLSCGRLSPRSVMTENQPPEITLDAPSFGSSARFNWRAHDPDGRIDHYVYALNPASVDRVDASWTRTEQKSAVVQFPRAAALGRATRQGEGAAGPQIFTVRAVDDRGAESAPAFLAVFDSAEVGPMVTIDNPQPNPVFTVIVPPTIEVRWHGQDLDGRIVKYKFQVFGQKNPDFPNILDFVSLVMSNPDTLNGLYGPDFASWTEVGGNVTSTTYSDLVPDELYLFAITALDDDGHYSTVFSPSTNLLRFAVTIAPDIGPQMCVSSPSFNYCSDLGGGIQDTGYEITTTALPVTWLAIPPPGASISGYRWVLDPTDTTGLGDINDKGRGPNRWTSWSRSYTSTTVGPFAAGSEHILYIQAKDNVGLFTTLRVRLQVVGFAGARQLLVVDDTRLFPDQFNASVGYYDPPRGTWPTAAELDTFLYARGGFPWKGY